MTIKIQYSGSMNYLECNFILVMSSCKEWKRGNFCSSSLWMNIMQKIFFLFLRQNLASWVV